MKDILIISNYYPPEKGAAANRIEQLALKLNNNQVPFGCHGIDKPKVINFWKSYISKFI